MRATKLLLGARIKELRKRRGLTQDQLAEQVDLATRYVSQIEVGRNAPSLEVIDNIAHVLGVEIKSLFDFSHLDPDVVAPTTLRQNFEGLHESDRRLLYRIAELMKE